jgi:hypothetical protein
MPRSVPHNGETDDTAWRLFAAERRGYTYEREYSVLRHPRLCETRADLLVAPEFPFRDLGDPRVTGVGAATPTR